MKTMLALLKKELTITFSSSIFYGAAFIFLIISGFSFWANVSHFGLASLQAAQNPYLAGMLNLTDMVVQPFFLDTAIVLLLMIPLISMRLYAEEKKAGTIELLFTYPISDRAVLCGKFLAAFLVLLILLTGTLLPFLVLSRFGQLDWGVLFTGYLGLTLLAAGFLAMGIFTSALVENQVVAAAISFGTLFLLLLIGWAKSVTGPLLGAILEHLSIADHLTPFVKGLLDTRHIIYYLVFTLFWLFLTLRYLNSRYWRG
jgi:ABC-2 type transport system permease protein